MLNAPSFNLLFKERYLVVKKNSATIQSHAYLYIGINLRQIKTQAVIFNSL